MVWFDLAVEETVLFDPGVAVDGPDQLEGVPATLVRLVAEDGRRRAAVHLDVASERAAETRCNPSSQN